MCDIRFTQISYFNITWQPNPRVLHQQRQERFGLVFTNVTNELHDIWTSNLRFAYKQITAAIPNWFGDLTKDPGILNPIFLINMIQFWVIDFLELGGIVLIGLPCAQDELKGLERDDGTIDTSG